MHVSAVTCQPRVSAPMMLKSATSVAKHTQAWGLSRLSADCVFPFMLASLHVLNADNAALGANLSRTQDRQHPGSQHRLGKVLPSTAPHLQV